MAASNYSACLSKILAYEGGYTNHPSDPGGATNYGITIIDARKYWKADATPTDMKGMPLSVAKSIYKSKYWDAVRGDDLPAGIDLCTFDPAVNSGVGRGGPWMAVGLGKPWKSYAQLVVDANACTDLPKAIRAACQKRLSFLRSLKTFSVFGKGWSSRVANVEASSITMARTAQGVSPQAIIAEYEQTIKDVKQSQATALPVASGGVVAAGGGTPAFWHWDALHASLLVLGVVIVAGLIWRVVHNMHTVDAYTREIETLQAQAAQAVVTGATSE